MEHSFEYLAPFLINLTRYVVLAGLPFLIFYVFFRTTFTKNKIQDRTANRADFKREVLHSLQATVVFAGIAVLFIKTPLSAYTRIYYDQAAYPWWWIPLSVVCALMVHDTYFYWMHRTAHHPALFKQVHVLHHRSVTPSPWASYSFQLVESILEGLIAPIILLLIPMHPLALLLFSTLAFVFNVYGHLGYEIAPRWFRHSWLFEVLNTSTHHNLHHAKFKGNYGLYLRVWDRLMGTEYPDYVQEYDKIQQRRFGTYQPVSSLLKGTVWGGLIAVAGYTILA